ncbi:MAG: InlB B-repeat-containing protein, partial [Acutalibacteraceae bacterium]
MKKRILSIMLALCMVLSFVHTTAFAAEETNDFTLSAVAGYPVGFNNERYANLFDGNTGTKWCCNFSGSVNVIFKASEPVKLSQYSIATANDTADSPGRNPADWTLSGCMNYTGTNTSWTEIDTVTDVNLPAENEVYTDFTLAETTPFYQYFKLEITKIKDGDVLQLSEVALTNCTLCEHQWEATGETIAPTCTEYGYDVISECSLCHWQKKVPNGTSALGHNFVDGLCTRCDADESAPYAPIKDINGTYRIGTAQELYWFAGLVNGTLTDVTDQNKSASAVLTKDIVVNTGVLKADGTLNTGTFTDWTPIGNFDNQYTVKFDGQNHTISGLYFNDSSTRYVGLFGCLGSGGEIKNVGVIDSYFSGYNFVGGVCGRNFGTIIGCCNTGTVSGSHYYAGGVCGYNYGTITGCCNTGTVDSYNNVGGVCGHNYGTITGCYSIGTVDGNESVGGVRGMNAGTVTGCYTNREGEKNTKSNEEFKNGTVCGLLNTALQNSNSVVRFYQGENYPERIFFVDGAYQISSVAELYGFLQLVNSGDADVNSIKLVADVQLSSILDLSGKNITIDLNGHVLSGADILINTGSSKASLTLTDSNPTATHTDSTLPLGGVVTSKISMKQDGGSFHDCILYGNGGTVTSEFTTNTNAVAIKRTSNTPTAFTGKISGYAHLYDGIYYSTIASPVTVHGKKATFKNGDKDYAYEIVSSGNNVVAPISPSVKAGYQTFDGWYDGDTKYTFGSTLDANITLTAKFGDPLTYNIACDLGGGTATNATSYNVESDAITLNNPAKIGYAFTGWS